MRKAAGIILITLGVSFLCGMIYILVVLGIMFGISIFLSFLIPVPGFVFLLGLVVAAAFDITGGIFCLRRKYWRVCLASASFAVFFLVFYFVFFLVLSPFPWGSSWSDYISMGWPIWVMVVAAVISVIFILRTKKEWQEISDSADGKLSYGG
jgi:uncharacterized membrane protein (DUF485 family)